MGEPVCNQFCGKFCGNTNFVVDLFAEDVRFKEFITAKYGTVKIIVFYSVCLFELLS